MRYWIPLLAAVTLATACSNNDLTNPGVTIDGTWNLRTLNGQSLPYTVGPSTTIIGEQLTLNTDGSYTDVAAYSNGNSFTEFGYYTVTNNAITFNDQTDSITYQGSISGSVLTEITDNGQFTAVYQKS